MKKSVFKKLSWQQDTLSSFLADASHFHPSLILESNAGAYTNGAIIESHMNGDFNHI